MARVCGRTAWLLTALFVCRVLGQAVQRWWPQSWLPPFEDFQGSGLPYGILLPSQLAIVALMAWYAWRMRTGAMIPARRAGRLLAWSGGLYLAGALLRLAVGWLASGAAPWFTARIPALFHIVLASYVLTVAVYHGAAGGRSMRAAAASR